MTPQEVLEKAAQAIANKGHCKGSYQNPKDGSLCALGAMRYAATGGLGVYLDHLISTDTVDLFDQAQELLATEIEKTGIRFQFGYDPIPMFNDKDSTTAEDVMLMMKRAAHA